MSKVNPEFMKHLNGFMPKPTQLLIESRVNKATAHLEAALSELCQSMALFGMESMDNNAYTHNADLLTYYWKALLAVLYAIREEVN